MLVPAALASWLWFVRAMYNKEFWGLLDYNWSSIRSQNTLENSLYKMIDALKRVGNKFFCRGNLVQA